MAGREIIGNQNAHRARHQAAFNTLPQLEIDRALGKIDEAEFQELRAQTPDEPRSMPVEALIYAWRRTRRLNTALEAEVLISRARRRRH